MVIGPATLNLAAGTETIVYAIGSATDKTLSLVVQTMTGLGGSPTGMPAGYGGLAAPQTPMPAWAWVLVALGGLLAVGGGATSLRAVRARR